MVLPASVERPEVRGCLRKAGLAMRQDQNRDYGAAVEELRRLAREPFEVDEEQQELRARLATEREASKKRLLEEIVQWASIDLRAILEEEARRRAERRRDVSEVLARLEARAGERASAEQRRLLRIRAQYLDTFSRPLAAQEEKAQLKFRETVFWSGDARPRDVHLSREGHLLALDWAGLRGERRHRPGYRCFIRACASTATAATMCDRARPSSTSRIDGILPPLASE
jgi:hypothetical protein